MNYNDSITVPGLDKLAFDYGEFPDPFQTYMSRNMPRTISDVLRWAERVWHREGLYRQAARRIVKFFMTSIDYEDIDDEEKKRWQTFNSQHFKAFESISSLGEDFMGYGNSLSTIFIPFNRYLRCPKCRSEWPISRVAWEFRDYKFCRTKPCPREKCGHTGPMDKIDRRSTDESRVTTIRWSPHYFRILYNPFTHDTRYIFKIPEDIKADVRNGNRFILETLPWEFIKTIQEDKDFEFHHGMIYHMKEETLAGVRNLGWGIPMSLPLSNKMYTIQVLNRFDEAIALDYVIPLRMITPKAGSSRMADPLRNLNLSSFSQHLKYILRQRRQDPAAWNVLPFPVEYAVYGGEAKELAPVESKTLAMDDLLNSMGIPAELYKMSLTTQAAPMALRIFTQLWSQWPAAINGWLDWAMTTISEAFSWDKPTVSMKPPTIADDIELRQIQLQLAAAQKMSMGTAMEGIGADFRKEYDRRMSEERYAAEKQREFQEEMENTAIQEGVANQAPPAQGGPAGSIPSSTEGMTPGDLQDQAKQLASQIVQAPPDQRRSMLAKIRKGSETLYALVKKDMQDMRQDAASAGRQMLAQGA